MIHLGTVSHLLGSCGGNLGGINYIRIIPAANVLRIPAPRLHIIPSEIELADGANYLDIAFSKDAGGFEEPMSEGDHGEYFKPELSVWVPKDHPEVGHWVQALTGIRCVAQYIDSNEVVKLIGSRAQPLTFSHKFTTGNDANQKNGHQLTFSGLVSHKAFYYQMFEVPPLGSRKVFSAGFTFGFRRQ